MNLKVFFFIPYFRFDTTFNTFYISVVKLTRCTSFSNLFQNNTLHVSDGLSVYHQDFKTVHTATRVCQTDTATYLQAGTRWNSNEFHLVPASKQVAVSV